ncbi:MAG: hypothetical protein ACJ78K_13095, partial [Gemmatimonadaceae bacterium]
MLDRYASIVVLVFFTFLASVACAASKDARPAAAETIPVQDSVSAASAGVASGTSALNTGVGAPSSSGNAAPSGSSSSTTRGAKDSAPPEPKITVPTVKGRTKRDSLELVKAVKAGLKNTAWPVRTAPPLPGSILPARRIVAFYGNPLSKKMGILGELPPDQMLARFDQKIAEWQKADPSHPVQPALHLIAVVAQGAPGRDGKYR